MTVFLYGYIHGRGKHGSSMLVQYIMAQHVDWKTSALGAGQPLLKHTQVRLHG